MNAVNRVGLVMLLLVVIVLLVSVADALEILAGMSTAMLCVIGALVGAGAALLAYSWD